MNDFPLGHVQQIHLAGHSRQTDEKGCPLLIDSHDQRVGGLVWNLFRQFIQRIGPVTSLLDWGSNIPAWSELQTTADIAEGLIGVAHQTTKERTKEKLSR